MAVPLTGHSEAAFRGRTVLVADDDTTIRDYLTARCRQVGLTVKTTADGLRTLLKVSKEDPDLLILDLNLPDVQGFRVCQRLTDPKFRPARDCCIAPLVAVEVLYRIIDIWRTMWPLR